MNAILYHVAIYANVPPKKILRINLYIYIYFYLFFNLNFYDLLSEKQRKIYVINIFGTSLFVTCNKVTLYNKKKYVILFILSS